VTQIINDKTPLILIIYNWSTEECSCILLHNTRMLHIMYISCTCCTWTTFYNILVLILIITSCLYYVNKSQSLRTNINWCNVLWLATALVSNRRELLAWVTSRTEDASQILRIVKCSWWLYFFLRYAIAELNGDNSRAGYYSETDFYRADF